MPRSASSPTSATPAATPASTRRRWSKFWWQDHERDPALRLCSLAAQGLWMRLLCLMHEAEPYGHLCVNGKPLHPRQIAQMVGVSPQQVRRYMAELQDAGVYATTAEGVPYSRRLVRDRAASDAGAAPVATRSLRPIRHYRRQGAGDNVSTTCCGYTPRSRGRNRGRSRTSPHKVRAGHGCAHASV
nr:winged helix-turn-helix domain-containing protein [Acetobacter ascendens]